MKIFLLFVVVILFLYEFGSAIWLKKHPKYDLTFIAAEIGAGKSCYAAKMAQKHLKKGWEVYSNDYIKGARKLDVSALSEKVCPEKSLLIIDEASLEFNSRSFAKTNLALIEYFKMCRHYKNKVILISQTFGDTDKQIRDLSSKIYFIRTVFGEAYPGLLSMPLRVKGHLGINLEGQPTMQYKIGNLGIPYFLPKYYKYFNSFSRVERPLVHGEFW